MASDVLWGLEAQKAGRWMDFKIVRLKSFVRASVHDAVRVWALFSTYPGS